MMEIGAGIALGVALSHLLPQPLFPLEMVVQDWCRHVLVTGLPGRGKSVFTYMLAVYLMQKGWSVVYISCQGDTWKLASLMAEKDLPRIVPFFPWLARVVGYNPLALHRRSEAEVEAVAGTVAATFGEQNKGAWSVEIERLLRYATRAACEEYGATLVDVWRVLTDEQFREKVVSKVRNPIVRQYFATEFSEDNKAIKKVGSPLANDLLLAVLAQKDGLDLSHAMRTGKVVLCDLDEEHLGPAAKTIAGLLLSGIRHAASTRDENSPPCLVVCDEWQMFAAWASQSIEDLLELMRKKSVAVCLASQHQRQFSDELRRAALLCGNRIIFDAHPEERAGLKREFGDEEWERCTNLPDRHFASQWTVHGRRRTLRRQKLPQARWTRTEAQVMEYVKSRLEPQVVYPTRAEVLGSVKLEKKRSLDLFPRTGTEE